MVKAFLAAVALIGLAGTGAGVVLATGGNVGPIPGSLPMGITVAGFSAALILVLIGSFTERRAWMILATLSVLAGAGAGATEIFSPLIAAAVALGAIGMIIAVTTRPTDIAGGSSGGGGRA